MEVLDESMRISSCPKLHQMKFKTCSRQADKQQIHNVTSLSCTIKTNPGPIKGALGYNFILHLTFYVV